MDPLTIITLLNALAPQAINLVLAIKHTNGSMSIAVVLDEADKQFDANLAGVNKWMAEHGKAPVTGG